MRRFKTFIVLISTLLLISCSQITKENITEAADTVFINGKIYTVNEQQPWVEAVAIKNGLYIAIGNEDVINGYIDKDTKIIDLKGKMVMPGINDAHSHLYGGLKALFYCNFPATSSPSEIEKTLRQCMTDNPEQDFIMGGYWASNFFNDHTIASPRLWLDSISTDKAIILSDDSGHNAWVNTKALKAVGFEKNTRDPIDGKILRDKQGEPNGLLYESVAVKVEKHFNKNWSADTNKKGMAYSLATANAYGITGIKDAASRVVDLQALYTIAQESGLTAHIATALFTPYGSRTEPLDYSYYMDLAKQYKTESLYTNFIKFYLDGVPTSSRSAAMVVPYHTDGEHPHQTLGDLHLQGELLAQDLIELDRRGFVIKLHGAGDRSVQAALDALEKMRKVNGNSNIMHEIAHAGFITDKDIARFKRLNVAVDLSPYLWYPSPIIDNIRSVLGDYTDRYWLNKTMLDAGAMMVAGSDWPAVSPTINPWPGIEATVTRKNPYGEATGTFLKSQALTLAQTLKIFTLNGAKSLAIDDKTGSVMLGKYADLIVLQDNLFEIDPDKISETKVLQTWFKGKRVF